MSRFLLVLCCTVVGGEMALAQNRPGSGEISIFAGLEAFDRKGIENDLVYGLRFGWNFTENIEIEAYYDRASTENQGGTVDIDLDNFGIDLLFTEFVTTDAHVPYVLIGLGHGEMDVGGVDQDYQYWEVGLGYRYFYNTVLGIRLDARTLMTSDSGDPGVDNFDIKTTIGLSFVFGGSR